MGEAYIALAGEILTGTAQQGSWECRSGHTRLLCTVLYYTIVLLYYCTIVLAHLHTCTLLQDTVHTIAGCGVLLLYSMALLHFIALLCCVKGSRGS